MRLLVSKRSLNISVCEWCIKSACTISGSLLVRNLELPNECQPNLKTTSLHQPQIFAVWYFGVYCNLSFRSGNSREVTNRRTTCRCVQAPASLPKACMVVEYASNQDIILQLSHHFSCSLCVDLIHTQLRSTNGMQHGSDQILDIPRWQCNLMIHQKEVTR